MNEKFRSAMDAIKDFRAEARARDDKAYSSWLDKQLTLSVGMLTLLVTFQEKYATASSNLGFLVPLCWVCLAASAIAGLLANAAEASVGGQRERKLNDAMTKALDDLEKIEARDEEAWDKIMTSLADKTKTIGYPRHERAKMFAVVALLSMGVGILVLVVFSIANWKW